MKKLPLLASLLAALLFAACAANPATGSRTFSLLSPDSERQIGEASAQATLKADGLYRPASTASQYVTGLCNRIYAVTEAAANPVQCNLTDSDIFNAHATPGYIFIERGLLPFLNSEAELAAVIGHESGHLTARHTNRAATQSIIASTLSGGALVFAGATTGAYGTVQAVSSTTALATELSLSTFSRSHETEADNLGRRYLTKAGYNPAEMVNTVRAMKLHADYAAAQTTAFNNGQIAPTKLLDNLKSSHPATPERIAAALAATGEPPVLAPEIDTGRQRYLAAINGLAYGPARRYGIARKGQLVLTQQRVVIPLPADTTTAYISSHNFYALGTWLVAHPASGAYLEVTSIRTLAGHNPGTFIEKNLPFLHEPVQRIQVGIAPSPTQLSTEASDPNAEPDLTSPNATLGEDGAETAAVDAAYVTPQTIGYTATYHYLNTPKRYRIFAVSAPATVDEMLVFTIVYPNQAVMQREDANLLSIIKNIRFLTKYQAKKYRQLEVHTFTAAIGQTVTQQAAHLPVGALQETLFRALNNLPEGTDLLPNQIYKTILDPNP